MLRGERDQNVARSAATASCVIPDCSGGSEIKTPARLFPNVGDGYQIAPGGARSKPTEEFTADGFTIPDCSGGSEIKTACSALLSFRFRYQIAPGGARSKRGRDLHNERNGDTRLLRGERDQNAILVVQAAVTWIPDCSGGSEIKTHPRPFQCIGEDTRLLRGERDQNGFA